MTEALVAFRTNYAGQLLMHSNRALELIAPRDREIQPVASSSCARRAALRKNSEICTCLVHPRAQIAGVIPPPCSADAHPIHEKIPEVPLAQQNSVATELVAHTSLRRSTVHVG